MFSVEGNLQKSLLGTAEKWSLNVPVVLTTFVFGTEPLRLSDGVAFSLVQSDRYLLDVRKMSGRDQVEVDRYLRGIWKMMGTSQDEVSADKQCKIQLMEPACSPRLPRQIAWRHRL
jgi:hypothetical protein